MIVTNQKTKYSFENLLSLWSVWGFLEMMVALNIEPSQPKTCRSTNPMQGLEICFPRPLRPSIKNAIPAHQFYRWKYNKQIKFIIFSQQRIYIDPNIYGTNFREQTSEKNVFQSWISNLYPIRYSEPQDKFLTFILLKLKKITHILHVWLSLITLVHLKTSNFIVLFYYIIHLFWRSERAK